MLERLATESFAFTRHAGSPDDRRAAVAANRLICDQPAKRSTIYRERLAAGSTIHGQPELRSSSGARPGDRAPWRESQACGAGARRLRGQEITRAAQQLRSPTGRPRPVARKPSLRSRRPATEGPRNNQSCAAAQEPDRATAPRGAKAKLTE